MIKALIEKYKAQIYLTIGFLLFTSIALATQFHFIADLWNPSWGDMVSVPLAPIPFSDLFLLWHEQFAGSFGVVNIPHFILSQFTPFVSPHYLQVLYINLSLIIIYFGVYNILHRFNIKSILTKVIATLLFSLFFLFSNVNITNYAQGQFETSFIYSVAFVAAFYLYFLFRDKKITDLLVVYFLLLIATWYNWLAIFFVGVFLLPEFIVLSIYYFASKRIKIVEYISGVIVIACLVCLSNLSIFYQLYFNLFSAISFTSSSSENFNMIKNEINYMYGNSTVLNSFYNSGNKGDISHIYFDYQSRSLDIDYTYYTILVPFNILILILLLFNFYKSKERNKSGSLDILIYISFVYYLLLVLFFYLIYSQSIDSFIDKIPFISIYRNPKKLMLSVYMLTLIVYVGLFIKSKDKKRFLCIILFLVLVNFVAKFQILTSGYLGRRLMYEAQHSYGDSFQTTFVAESSYPTYYLGLKDFLRNNNLTSTERIIVVPNNSQTLYESFLRYDFPLFHVPANANILSGGDVNSSLIAILYNRIINTDDISNILKIGNIRYVVVDRKSPYYLWNYTDSMRVREFGSTWLWGEPEAINRKVSLQNNLKLAFKDENFYIYEFVNHSDNILYIPNSALPYESLIDTNNASLTSDLYVDASEDINSSNGGVKIAEITKESSTEYIFKLNASSHSNAPIFFSQKYNPYWELKLVSSDESEIIPTKHTIGNSFGNLWVVELDEGEYTGYISLKTQKNNILYTWISLITVVLSGLYYLINKIKFSKK